MSVKTTMQQAEYFNSYKRDIPCLYRQFYGATCGVQK